MTKYAIRGTAHGTNFNGPVFAQVGKKASDLLLFLQGWRTPFGLDDATLFDTEQEAAELISAYYTRQRKLCPTSWVHDLGVVSVAITPPVKEGRSLKYVD